jgi:hypothetical protein
MMVAASVPAAAAAVHCCPWHPCSVYTSGVQKSIVNRPVQSQGTVTEGPPHNMIWVSLLAF